MGKESWYSPLNTLGPQVSHKKLLPADILIACLGEKIKEALFIKCPAVEEFNLSENFFYARFIE